MSLKMRRKDRVREDRGGLKCSCDGRSSPPGWRENENAGVEAALSLWVRLSIITVKWHIPTAHRRAARGQRCRYRLSQQVSAPFPNSKLPVLFISRVFTSPPKAVLYSVRKLALKNSKASRFQHDHQQTITLCLLLKKGLNSSKWQSQKA